MFGAEWTVHVQFNQRNQCEYFNFVEFPLKNNAFLTSIHKGYNF
jgi:hypothetical protein